MCGPDDMPCWGGMDENDCPVADFCIPNKGPVGKDGFECPAHCPMKCGTGEMVCPGGTDPNDCPMPDVCTSATTCDDNSGPPSPVAPTCKNKWTDKKCNKKKGKCNKKNVKKNCKKTCGQC